MDKDQIITTFQTFPLCFDKTNCFDKEEPKIEHSIQQVSTGTSASPIKSLEKPTCTKLNLKNCQIKHCEI